MRYGKCGGGFFHPFATEVDQILNFDCEGNYQAECDENRLRTLAVIFETASSTRIELGQVIDPTENTWPPLGVS